MLNDFIKDVKKIIRTDKRFQVEAYTFVMECLHFYTQNKKLPTGKHITGRELLLGFRDYAQKSFGPMAKFTLNLWGIHTTQDVGDIVYNMIDKGLMGREEADSLDDFKDVYNFDDIFKEDYFSEEAINNS
ncbi:MAG: hypothetical protein KAI43_11235 [Candidatus Aureabacteria bacterium]|nr:hypothetical protein [Candidatus Auribacterota bacterium]